ncbi:fumarylacetoacetate hydrolase family protein [Microbacterium sp. BWT-B31]|uniref:2-keto-4-pentenoate hydratase n=1 Tax=Microbacterium sp. BWT-B31 TaxID=3232072 RepID=UPI003527F785
MPATDQLTREIADALARATALRAPIDQPSASHDLSVDDAYRIQARGVAARVERGERVVGHKVGLTSLAMQRQLGVDQPDFGVITDAMVVPHAGALSLDELIAPRLEPEFAFRIDRALPASPTTEQVAAAIGAVAVSIEVIDSRVRDWRIGLADTIADNASSARIVLGAWVAASGELLARLADTRVALERDGTEVAAGPGSAVLGDPVVAVHWLATTIGRYGQAFEPGSVVLSGAVCGAVAPDGPGTWRAIAQGFEPAVLRAT